MMAVGSRKSAIRPQSMDAMVDTLTTGAAMSSRLNEELEALAEDSLASMRAMIEHGNTEERIMVFKALSPIIVKLNSRTDTATNELDAADRARQILRGHWQDIA